MAGFIGSSELETSVAGAEIVPSPPIAWVNAVYAFNRFELLNDQDCHVIINNSSPIFIRANQGVKIEKDDIVVKSFKIVEAGVTYSWIAHY